MTKMTLRPELLDRLACPQCGRFPLEASTGRLVCPSCGACPPVHDGIPLFTPPPGELVPSERIARGPELGTPWRQANWRFLQQEVARLAPEAVLLDVGAGRGDFAEAFQGRAAIALDVYPYPEVDLVCDLTQANPFRPASFEAAVVMNVLEHVYDTHALLDALARLLKPGGALILAIPFMVKIHQAPVDFVRFTHFALERLGQDHGLVVERLEGYYDPIFFLGEGIGNLKWSVLPGIQSAARYPARLLLACIELLARGLGSLLGKGQSRPPAAMKSLAPTGYQIIYRKPD